MRTLGFGFLCMGLHRIALVKFRAVKKWTEEGLIERLGI